jgi:hypothetical protein
MEWLIKVTLIGSIISFFIVVGLCIADAFGFLKTPVQRKAVNKMFVISLVTLLVAVGGFVTYAFRYLSFSAEPYLGFMDGIANIQKALIEEQILHDHPDGVLGPNTFKAVRVFQTVNKLKDISGAIDQDTIDKLFDWRSRPASPINKADQDKMRRYLRKPNFKRMQEQTRWFQTVLNKKKSYNGKLDGILREDLLDAVSNFQSNRGLYSDGTIGPDTLLCAVEYDINQLDVAKRLKDIKN